MEHHSIIFPVFLIFAGAATFSTLALYMRQSLLVAYMLFGIIFGPWGFQTISDIDLVNTVDDIGVILFMFLLGLQLHQNKLLKALSKTIWVAIISSTAFCVVGFLVSFVFGYNAVESLIIGICMMFSSTIISIKLLSSHHANKKIKETLVSILLLQDFIAIIAMLGISTASHGRLSFSEIALIFLALPSILLFVFLVERFVLNKIFTNFSGVREYMLLIAIAWCLGVAELAKFTGLSYEVGAFIAGIAIATSPTATYIAEQLKPIRDFFLVLFFFVIGASFNFSYLSEIILPAILLSIIFMALKPWLFSKLLHLHTNTSKKISWEIGIRLGQISEFSLLVILLACRTGLVRQTVVSLIQAVTMFLFIASSYLVLATYPMKLKSPTLIKAKAK